MSNDDFTFGGLTIPRDCKRIFITAKLQTTNGDPRLQPTGFPDVGPVFYPDPSDEGGQICLIESEASMANLLEEVALSDSLEEQATGTLHSALQDLPYIKVFRDGEQRKVFETASTIDGHRFASSHIMLKAVGQLETAQPGGEESAAASEEIVEYIKRKLESADGKRVPTANVPIIYQLVMELDPMALIHGFQISNDRFKFVGCRCARALTACIIGLDSQLVGIPGVRMDPLEPEAGQAGQAIFRKERVVNKKGTEARFSIDVGLLRSLPLAGLLQSETDKKEREKKEQLQETRANLLIALSLWKVARFLEKLQNGFRRRTECDLALKSATYRTTVLATGIPPAFPFNVIVQTATKEEGKEKSVIQELIENSKLPKKRSPLELTINGKPASNKSSKATPKGQADANPDS